MPGELTVAPGEVHVWRVALAMGELERFETTLDAAERAHAERFRTRRDRDRFVIARGALREILARYLRGAPTEIRFAAGPLGKPRLREPSTLCFNVSRSQALALVAVTRDREVGVDVERLRTDFADDAIADRFFAPSEAAALRRLPRAERTRAFFRLWTCKEAFVKAVGCGLTVATDRFGASIDGPPILHAAGGGLVTGWTLSVLAVGDDYAGALAVEGSACRVREWDGIRAPTAARSPA